MSKTFSDSVRAPRWAPGLLGWSQRRADDTDVIFLVGELDLAAAPELRRRLVGAVKSSTATRITLDLSGVSFLDAHCAGVIVAAAEAAADRGRTLRVDGLRGIAERVFDVLGLEPMVARRVMTGDGGSDSGGR
ncbi:STAS domain-containing protein [Actinoplanes sp. NPDC051411]|uniref:STAS domain-containing protein n=1 Tax=Actinoplanes sp. NPDC051411 TaxID=3155522 RepID=UPI003422EFE3